MHVVLYGSKTFVLENTTAATLVLQAAELKRCGLEEAAAAKLRRALLVESGRMSAAEAAKAYEAAA